MLDNKIIISICIILLSIVIYLIISNMIKKSIKNGYLKDRLGPRFKTYIKMFISIIRYVIVFINVLIILDLFNVNIKSVLAGVGVFGIIIGLAIQDSFKDFIRGIVILNDSYFHIGDVIKFKNIIGKVESIGLNTTKVRDIYSNNLISIANRNIDSVEILSDWLDIEIPIDFNLSLKDRDGIMNKVLDELNKIKKIEKVEFKGINNISASCLKCLIRVYTNPINKPQMKRDCLNTIISQFEKENIKIPYNKIDVKLY